jgi:tetratricopeptide (TPR) repeat protein
MRAMCAFLRAFSYACAVSAVLGSHTVAAAGDKSELPAAVVERLEIIRLLKADDFAALESRLAKVAEMAATKPSLDWSSVQTLSAFEYADPEIAGPLGRWRDAHPESFAPHLAFGLYSTHLGWVVRGNRFVRDTNAERFVEMRKYFDAAKSSLQTALKYDPKIDTAWNRLIGIAMAAGGRDAVETLFQQALIHRPKSSSIYHAYYHAIGPEWGGSTARQFALRARMQGIFHGNSDFAWAANFDDEKSAWSLYREDKNAEAVAKFDELIGRGAGVGSRRGRAYSLRALGKYEEAVAELERVVELGAVNPEAYFELADMQATRKQYWAAARRNMGIGLLLDPYNPRLLVRRAKFLMDHAKLDLAKIDLDNALFFGALDDRVREALRRYNVVVGDKGAAIAETENMVRLVPGNLENWLKYGSELYANQDCRALFVLQSYLDACRDSKDCNKGGRNKATMLIDSIRPACN